jgi:hypothetical protein
MKPLKVGDRVRIVRPGSVYDALVGQVGRVFEPPPKCTAEPNYQIVFGHGEALTVARDWVRLLPAKKLGYTITVVTGGMLLINGKEVPLTTEKQVAKFIRSIAP